MFRWLSRLVRPTARREIFRYHDGRRWRYADPLRLLRALDDRPDWRDAVQAAVLSVSVDSARLSPALAGQVANKPKLIGDLADVARGVFGVLPVGTAPDGRPVGLTDVECVGLLSEFMIWCARTSESYRPLASWPARPAPSPGGSDTGEPLVCTSTAT